MATIQIADKPTLDTVNTKLTDTRMGYIDRIANSTYGLDKIKSLIDTVKTTIDNINTATAATSTANKTGTLSAKIAYIISLLENTTYGLNALKTSMSGGSSPIKSIQRGTASIGYQKQSTTVTINAVDLNKAVLITTGGFIDANTESNNPQTYRAEITNSTTLTFYCAYYANGTISWQVIEFN